MSLRIGKAFLLMAITLGLFACGEEAPQFDPGVQNVHTDKNFLKDGYGRYVHFRGLNVSCNAKVPKLLTGEEAENKGRDFSYVGRPFPLEQADEHFRKIKSMGFNAVRLLFIWEAVFPDNREVPDTEFLDYFEAIIQKAKEHDLYVLLNMHENLFSRHLWAGYNEHVEGEKGDFENMLNSLFPDSLDESQLNERYKHELCYTDKDGNETGLCHSNKVVGDGAPLWAVKACLPEKEFDSGLWGLHPLLGTIGKNEDAFPGSDVLYKIQLAAAEFGLELPDDFADDIEAKLPGEFKRTKTCDMLPWTSWWNNMILSVDVNRCYAALYAGDSAYPNVRIDKVAKSEWDSFAAGDIPEALAHQKALHAFKGVDGKDYYYVYKHADDENLSENAMDLKTFLQGSFKQAWVEVAKRAGKYDHVIGYDLMNEPAATFYVLALVALYFELGMDDALKELLNTVLGSELDLGGVKIPGEPDWEGDCEAVCEEKYESVCSGCANDCATLCGGCEAACADDPDALACAECEARVDSCTGLCQNQQTTCNMLCNQQEALCVEMCMDPDRDLIGTKIFYLLRFLDFFPKDTEWETRVEWGFADADLFGMIGMLDAFDVFMLQPFFELIGNGIQAVDDDAIIWLEPTSSGGLQGETYMTKPESLDQCVYAPHYYPDIYPFWGFNMPSRDFSVDEIQYRTYTEEIAQSASWAEYTLSYIPTVFGEFGTYWNYKYKNGDWSTPGFEQSPEQGYTLSMNFLDNYYESYEELFMSNFLWCYTIDNTHENGDGWNKENFSILDPNQNFRGQAAYSRPYPLSLSGKPVSMHFHSDFHYFEPEKGVQDTEHEFSLTFESKETNAPTVIYVPKHQYPDGFYIWLSDGEAAWDDENQQLYYYPENDAPKITHNVVIRPPMQEYGMQDWSYFVKDGEILSR